MIKQIHTVGRLNFIIFDMNKVASEAEQYIVENRVIYNYLNNESFI